MRRRAPILHLFPYEPDEAFALFGMRDDGMSRYGDLLPEFPDIPYAIMWSELYIALGGRFVHDDGPPHEYTFDVDGELIRIEFREIEDVLDTFESFGGDRYVYWAWLGHLVEQTLRDPANPFARFFGRVWLATAGDHLFEIADVETLDAWSYNVGLLERRGIWWPREVRHDE